jgi:hypothetical protein
MANDNPVYHAFAYNPSTIDYDIWVGVGTREAIRNGGFRGDGIVLWCPHERLVDGWSFRVLHPHCMPL